MNRLLSALVVACALASPFGAFQSNEAAPTTVAEVLDRGVRSLTALDSLTAVVEVDRRDGEGSQVAWRRATVSTRRLDDQVSVAVTGSFLEDEGEALIPFEVYAHNGTVHCFDGATQVWWTEKADLAESGLALGSLGNGNLAVYMLLFGEEFLAPVRAANDVRLKGVGVIAGELCDVVAFSNAVGEQHVWISRRDGLMRRVESRRDDGSLNVVSMRRIRAPVELSDDVFRPSKGASLARTFVPRVPPTHETAKVRAGMPFPALELRDTNGQVLTRAEAFGSGPVVVECWGTWCKRCVAKLGEVGEAARELADEGVRVVALHLGNDDLGAVREVLRGRAPSLETVLVSADALETLDLFSVPAVFLLDADGTIRYRGNPVGGRFLTTIQTELAR